MCLAVVAACSVVSVDVVCEPPLSLRAASSTQALGEDVLLAQCGATLEFDAVNYYTGEFPNVQTLEDSVVIVNGNCSGTLIDGGNAKALVLTAGHCVEAGDDAFVVFNHEVCADGDAGVWNGTVVERSSQPDYALIELDDHPDVRTTRLGRTPSVELAIIQHPLGQPKAIAEGLFFDESAGILRYIDLDTAVGSSGAGVLGTDGTLVAIHSQGECDEDGGSNSGWTTEAIVSKSRLLSASIFE